jgi:MoaA/NifB/PqqE/SkfB family radical SAM enzyme
MTLPATVKCWSERQSMYVITADAFTPASARLSEWTATAVALSKSTTCISTPKSGSMKGRCVTSQGFRNEALASERSFHPRAPLAHQIPSIDWWITSRCNLQCDFCYGPAQNRDARQLRAQISNAIAASPASVVTFCGGEPLTVRNIFSYATTQRRYGKHTILNTNGELIFRIREKNNQLPFDVIGISVDGSDAVMHQAMRGAKANFEKTIEAASWVSTHEIAKLKIATVVSSVNVADLPNLAAIVGKLQPSVWRLYQYSPRGSWNRGQARHSIPDGQFEDAVAAAAAIVTPIRVSSSSEAVNRGCLIVDTMGTVLLPRYQDYVALGNCLAEPIEEIWMRSPDQDIVRQNKQWLLNIDYS